MTGSPGPTTDQEALQEDFLGALEALGGSAGNGKLCNLLGWDEAAYEAVKEQLLSSGQLQSGRGRGGSVSLAGTTMAEGSEQLRGDYKQSDYGKVILPFTVLRRLDCVLEPSKEAVLAEKQLREGQGLDPEPFLLRVAGQAFCNSSALSMKRLMGDQDNIG